MIDNPSFIANSRRLNRHAFDPVVYERFQGRRREIRAVLNRIVLAGMLCWGGRTGLAAPELAIAPAVELNWQTLSNRLYQVMAADNLAEPVWREAGAPMPGTGALVRKVLLGEDATHRFFRVVELEGTVTNWLAGLSELDFRPAKLVAQDGGIRAEGARANAVGISKEDLVTTRFQFDLESQSLKLVQYEIIPRIGVFHDRFFGRDVAEHPAGTLGERSVADYTWLSASGTNIVLSVTLEPGAVLNFGVMLTTREHSMELLGPDGQRIKYSIMESGASYVEPGYPVLRGGQYQVRLRPRSSSSTVSSMSCRIFFANNNGTRLRDVSNGGIVSANLRENTHDYAKYRVRMNRGQVLRLSDPASGIGILVLTSASEKVADVVGLPLIFEAPKQDDYYLFVYRYQPGSGILRYASSVSIEDR